MKPKKVSFPRVRIVLILVVGLVAGFFVNRSSAQTVNNLTGCQTISSSGSYRLSNNVTGGSGPCFSIRASNVTFDGNGKTITSPGGDAVEVADYGSGPFSNVTISNVTSTSGTRVYGNNSNITIQNSTFAGFSNYSGDTITLTHNTINGGLDSEHTSYGCANPDPVCTSWNNAIGMTVTNNIFTGSGGRFIVFKNYGDATHPCPASNRIISNNVITNNEATDPDNPLTIYLACSTNDQFTNNTVTATGTASGVLVRDGWSTSTFSGNTIRVHTAVGDTRAALSIVSGNENGAAKGSPSGDLFSNNTFIGDNAKSFLYQIAGSNNQFISNVFHSNSAFGDQLQPNSIYDHNTFVNSGSGSTVTFTSGPNATTWTNNIVENGSNSNPVVAASAHIYTGFTAHHNLYHNRSGAATFTGASSFGQWRTVSGEAASSFEVNPLFVNYAGANYHLQSTSPARGTGSSGSDLGALPYGGSSCTETWSCGAWSTCTNGSQSRSCTDANACGTTTSRPPLTQSCTVSCTESWSCGTWSSCVNNKQSRTCTDANACGTTATRPALTQACTSGSSCVESWTCGAWSTCVNNSQSRTCADANSCKTTTTRPPLTQVCAVVDLIAPAAVTDLTAR